MSNMPLQQFRAGDEYIDVVSKFVLLGFVVEEDGNCRMELMRRLALGGVAVRGLERIWKDRDLSVSTKARLMTALVLPIATYGFESWMLRKGERAKINTFELWCWRRMLRIPWTAKRTNASICKQVEAHTFLDNIVKRRKLMHFGHVMRSDGLEKDIMLGMGEGSRKRTRWTDDILEWTRLSLYMLTPAMVDRVSWRKMVLNVTMGRLRLDGTR